jgi:hypothetical protein
MHGPVEELQIAKEISIGVRDVGSPCLWFEAEGLHGSSLQVLNWEDAQRFIKDVGVYDITKAKNIPIICKTDGNMIRFIRVKK